MITPNQMPIHYNFPEYAWNEPRAKPHRDQIVSTAITIIGMV